MVDDHVIVSETPDDLIVELLAIPLEKASNASYPVQSEVTALEFEEDHRTLIDDVIEEYGSDEPPETSETSPLSEDVQLLLEGMDEEDVKRALEREQALQASDRGRQSKVDLWADRINNQDFELEDIEVGTVSEGADMSEPTYYKLRKRLHVSGED